MSVMQNFELVDKKIVCQTLQCTGAIELLANQLQNGLGTQLVDGCTDFLFCSKKIKSSFKPKRHSGCSNIYSPYA